jgi:hypothetical protein
VPNFERHSRTLKKLAQSLAAFIAASVKAKRSSGTGILSQLVEIARLRQPPNCISPSEYYDFNLSDKRKLDWAAKNSYLGWRSPVITDLQNPAWRSLANDKLNFYGLMRGLGFQVPHLYAIYSQSRRFFGNTPVFSDTDSLADFLRHGCPYPFYGKPADGSYGAGNILCTAYIPESDSLLMASGSPIKIDAFFKDHLKRSRNGYLFQQVLQPSSAISELLGNRLSSVRIVVALCDDGPRLITGEWKIMTGNNIIDNFHDGTTGNLMAVVDTANGSIQRIALPGGTITSEHSVTHPDTGVRLMGTAIPNWTAMTELVLTASRAFPGLRLQGWDIADTTTGLIPLEVNLVTGRTAYNHQRRMGRGLFDESVKKTWLGLRK